MFKLIFKTMTIVVFLIFLTVGLALWRGGEPFRWLGEGFMTIGKTVSHFGDFVDDVIAGGRKVQKNYDQLKDVLKQNSDT